MGIKDIIAIILGSGVVAALLTSLVDWLLEKRRQENIGHERLYGPLRFNLLMMKLLVENRKEVLEDIKQWASAEVRIDLMQNHMSPLTLKWLQHKDKIKILFESNSGLIKKSDYQLVYNFMDGCVKREIIEEGKNLLAVNENRTNKLLEAVEIMQQKYLQS